MGTPSSVPEREFSQAITTGFIWLDRMRRHQGQVLEQLGFGALELPHRVVAETAEFRLRAYQPAGTGGPVLLIIPAPIKRCYIWDLSPGHSVVRAALQAGLAVYMIEWLDRESGAQSGLDDYADRLIGEALDAVTAETGKAPVFAAGHSLGGTLAAIFAARRPSRLSGLILVEAPLHFDAGEGPFAAMLAARPQAPDVGLSEMPGSMLGLIGTWATPWNFVAERWLDAFNSRTDPEHWATHGRVERWTLDEFAMPGLLFREVVDQLYRADLFQQNKLKIGGRFVGPAQFKTPTLAIVAHNGALVETQQMVVFLEASGSRGWRSLTYRDEVGVGLQHVGPLVGRGALKLLWAPIFEWLLTIAGSGSKIT